MLQTLSKHKNSSTVNMTERELWILTWYLHRFTQIFNNNMTQTQEVWKSVLNVTFWRKLRRKCHCFMWNNSFCMTECEGQRDRRLYSTVLGT